MVLYKKNIGDVLPTFRAKPKRWQSSGKRVNRGLFRTVKNILLNADANSQSSAQTRFRPKWNQ